MNFADNLDYELEMELERELSKEKETYMNTLLSNADRNAPQNTIKDNVISVGPFKGTSTSEAVSKVMKKNETLPNAIRNRERDEAKDKLTSYNARLAQLEAEHEVRVESIASVYDHKVNNNQMIMKDLLDQIKELSEQIKTIDNRVGELTVMNSKIMEDKQSHINSEKKRTKEQRDNLNQIIHSIEYYIENLAMAVN